MWRWLLFISVFSCLIGCGDESGTVGVELGEFCVGRVENEPSFIYHVGVDVCNSGSLGVECSFHFVADNTTVLETTLMVEGCIHWDRSFSELEYFNFFYVVLYCQKAVVQSRQLSGADDQEGWWCKD